VAASQQTASIGTSVRPASEEAPEAALLWDNRLVYLSLFAH
jgi:hypothetical protein